jgi:hypothetical protein
LSVINGFAYLAMSFTGLLLSQYEDEVSNIAFPAQLGEIAIMLWLLIKGAKPQLLDTAALSSRAECPTLPVTAYRDLGQASSDNYQ